SWLPMSVSYGTPTWSRRASSAATPTSSGLAPTTSSRNATLPPTACGPSDGSTGTLPGKFASGRGRGGLGSAGGGVSNGTGSSIAASWAPSGTTGPSLQPTITVVANTRPTTN